MEPYNLIFFLCYLLISTGGYIRATQGYRPTKIFVFGDSYADTGNIKKSLGNSWKDPYGITFPGKPAGRFSDGRVLTDYFASFFGMKSPIPHTWMKFGRKKFRNGMNFAYGGSGVFNTYNNLTPNISTQIDFLEKLINDSFYTKQDLESSVILVCLAGNDYGAYTTRGGSPRGLPKFIPVVINQLAMNLKRIRGLGASKITVTGLEPLGCLPQTTQLSSYEQCNATQNLAVNYHNLLLQQTVAKLNNETKNNSNIFILDLYNSFTDVLEQKRDYQGNLKFETPLKPCCMGISSGYNCGSMNEKGGKMYTVCSDPKSAFFWDVVHPTEAGWHAVYINLKSSLEQFFKFV